MTNAAPTEDTPTYRLTYHSHSTISASERKSQLGAIFSVARSRNKKADITGALMVYRDQFVQVLEGDESAVCDLYDHICKDERHERVTLVDQQTVPGRTFGRWAMAEVSEGDEPDIPLIMNVNKGGAVPAAGRPITPEQEPILQQMRDSLRDSVPS